MNLSIIEIKYETIKNFETELKLNIAIARVDTADILVISLKNEEASQTFYKSAGKILRAMKRKGQIQFFLTKEELQNFSKTETAYLMNKHPEVTEKIQTKNSFFLLKL